jgi:hypothetical protein
MKIGGKKSLSASEISEHLGKYGTSKQISMYLLGGHDKAVAKNVKVTKDSLEFDMPKNIALDLANMVNDHSQNDDLSKGVKEYFVTDSHADGAWEDSKSNILLIMKDGNEYAKLKPKNVKVSNKLRSSRRSASRRSSRTTRRSRK